MAPKKHAKKPKAPPAKKKAGFQIRNSYRIPFTVMGIDPETGKPAEYELVHVLRPFDDEAYGDHSAGVVGIENGENDEPTKKRMWVEFIRQTWAQLIVSVEGYEGIDPDKPLSEQAVAQIPFKHVQAVYGRFLIEERAAPGEPQKN